MSHDPFKTFRNELGEIDLQAAFYGRYPDAILDDAGQRFLRIQTFPIASRQVAELAIMILATHNVVR